MNEPEFPRDLAQRVESLERRVQRLEAREGLDSPGSAMDVPEDEIVALLRKNRKIEAVKLYCEATGVGLAEAGAAVELIEANYLSGG